MEDIVNLSLVIWIRTVWIRTVTKVIIILIWGNLILLVHK